MIYSVRKRFTATFNPDECTDCGACVPPCDYNSIYPIDDLPENLKSFAKKRRLLQIIPQPFPM